MKITIGKKVNLKQSLPNQIVKALIRNPDQQLFWQEPGCFQSISQFRYNKCNCIKQGQNNKLCFQQLIWLKYTYINPTLKQVSDMYQQLPYTKNPEISYVYQLIQMHIYKKLGHLLIGQEQKRKAINILFKFANSNLKIKRIPYLQAYGWLTSHILYHTSQSKTYYIMDQLVQRLKLYDIEVIKKQQMNVIQRLKETIPKSLYIFEIYNINPLDVIRYFSEDIFSRSINSNFMGWNIQKYFELGWEHFIEMMCSYIDVKLETNRCETRNELYKNFFSTGTVQWPIVFANLALYKKKI